MTCTVPSSLPALLPGTVRTHCNCELTHCVRDWGLSELFGAQRTDSVQDDVRVSDYRE